MKTKKIIVGWLFLQGLLASASAQSLLTNGSFEVAGFAPPLAYIDLISGSTVIPGWTVMAGSVDWLQDVEPEFAAHGGHYSIDIYGGSPGTIRHDPISTVPGRSYVLTCYAGSNDYTALGYDPSGLALEAGINGAYQRFVLPQMQSPLRSTNYNQLSLVFTATNSSTTISFRSAAPFPDTGPQPIFYGPVIDDISVALFTPHISIRCSQIGCSQVEVCWSSVTNKLYQLRYRSILNTNLWTDLGSPTAGTGTSNCVLDAVAPGASQRFYQVLELP